MKLKEYRKKARMTQKEVATLIGVNQNTYSYWENEKTKIDNVSLKKLADIFQATTDDLLDRGNIDPKTPIHSKDLIELLRNEDLKINGRVMSQEEKERVLRIIEAVYWKANEITKNQK